MAALFSQTGLTLFRDRRLINAKGRQRPDATQVLAALQTLNRLEGVGETLRHALSVLATVAPDWLQPWAPAVWYDRYSRRFAEDRLPPERPARYALAAQMGTDGRQLRCTVDEPAPPLAAGDPRHPDLAAGVAAAVLGDPREPTSALAPRG